MYIFDNVVDMDFSSMYPHIIIAFNIERNTMIGKLLFEDEIIHRYPHLFMDDDDESNYDPGKDFMDNYLTGDINSIGSKWFNLPDFSVIDADFRKKFKIRDKIKYKIKAVKDYFADGIDIE